MPEADRSVLTVERLGKRYGDRWLFRGIDFCIEKGQRLAVLGPNGSGKSTLLRIVSGLLPPSEGQIRLAGDLRQVLGVCSIEMSLYPVLSAREHLSLAGELRGCDPRSEELLRLVGLAEAPDLPSAKLSTGMRTRLKLALAIQPSPRLLVLDEPSAGLDEPGKTLVERIITEQGGRGAVLLATNDPRERRLATHELVLAA